VTGNIALLLMQIRQLTGGISWNGWLFGLLLSTIVIVGITIGVWLYRREKGDK